MSTTPRLRRSYTATFRFAVGQHVSLCGFQATVHDRLRSAAGHALYRVQLAGELFTRTVMEDGLEPLPARSTQARAGRTPLRHPRGPLLLLPEMAAA